MATTDFNAETGALDLYPGQNRTAGSAARVRYVAGWTYETLPAGIKQATANIVRNGIDAQMPTGVKTLKAGDATITRFAPTVIDADTRELLAPYRSYRV